MNSNETGSSGMDHSHNSRPNSEGERLPRPSTSDVTSASGVNSAPLNSPASRSASGSGPIQNPGHNSGHNSGHGANLGSSHGTNHASGHASSLQNYHMLAFRKALHPEFFGIEGRQRVQHGDYETEAWIFRGGHNLRFQLNGFCITEVVVEHIDQIPDRGLIAALPCAGERDFEEKVAENLIYMTTMQTETLSDHLYLGTYKEMMQHARENDSLFAAWTDAAGKPNLSLIDVQHFRSEVHIQGYHLRSDCGLVLRTQSMVQIVAPKGNSDKKSDKKLDRKSDKKSSGLGDRPTTSRSTAKSSGARSSSTKSHADKAPASTTDDIKPRESEGQ